MDASRTYSIGRKLAFSSAGMAKRAKEVHRRKKSRKKAALRVPGHLIHNRLRCPFVPNYFMVTAHDQT